MKDNSSRFEVSGDNEVFLPAAPGTYALMKGPENKVVWRRGVVAWAICDLEANFVVLPVVPTKGFDDGLWLFADAVQHPEGHIESLSDGRIWADLKAFENDKAWPIREAD